MSVSDRRPLLAALLLLGLGVAARGQSPGAPPPPVPVLPPAVPGPQPTLGPPVPNSPGGVSVQVQPVPPPVLGPAPGSVPPPPPPGPPPGPSPFAPPDPGRNGWGPFGPCSNQDPFFAAVDLDVVGPSVVNHLRGTVTHADGTQTNVAVPRNDLDWTVMPRFEIGYRLPDSLGAFAFSYRFLADEGNGHDAAGDALRSRLNVNVFDFDYLTSPYEPLPRWELKWRVGIRLTTNYYDDRGLAADGTGQRESNYFIGAGPHGGLDVARNLPILPGFALVGKVDGAVLVGQTRQRYADTFAADGGTLETDEVTHRLTRSVEMVTLEAGVRYTPPGMEYLRFSAGYQFEHWWALGQNGANLQLNTNGAFLRAEIDF